MKLKSISFGVDHCRKSGWDNYFLNKYKDYIDSIYLSLPDKVLGKLTTSRTQRFLRTFDQKYYENIIDYARSLGIKINFTINKNGISDEFLLQEDIIQSIIKVINSYKPDEICTTDYLIQYLSSNITGPKFIRTFLETQLNNTIIDKNIYDIYILRNHNFFNLMNNTNLGYRLIPNVCCPGCCRQTQIKAICPMCKDVFDSIINKPLGLENYLATHAWTGEDIAKFEQIFSNINFSYKLASRVFCYQKCEPLIENYISGQGVEHIIATDCYNIAFDYFYFNHDYLKQVLASQFDLDAFNHYKVLYWDNIINRLPK